MNDSVFLHFFSIAMLLMVFEFTHIVRSVVINNPCEAIHFIVDVHSFLNLELTQESTDSLLTSSAHLTPRVVIWFFEFSKPFFGELIRLAERRDVLESKRAQFTPSRQNLSIDLWALLLRVGSKHNSQLIKDFAWHLTFEESLLEISSWHDNPLLAMGALIKLIGAYCQVLFRIFKIYVFPTKKTAFRKMIFWVHLKILTILEWFAEANTIGLRALDHRFIKGFCLFIAWLACIQKLWLAFRIRTF